MATTNDDDPQQRFALGVVFILLGLLLSTVIGTVVYQFGFKADTAQAVAAGAPTATSTSTSVGTAGAALPGAPTAVASGTGAAVVSGSGAAVVPEATTATGSENTTPAVPESAAAGASESTTADASEGATVQVVDGVVKFFFATGSADIAPGAAEALAQVIQGVASGRQTVVSGFHDPTGDRAMNEALAKRRAESVRDVLVSLGVPTDRIRLEKPAETTGSGANALARRVEVMLVD